MTYLLAAALALTVAIVVLTHRHEKRQAARIAALRRCYSLGHQPRGDIRD